MRPMVHASVSVLGGVLLGGISGSWPAAICSVISGTLVDLDHFFDYFIVRGKWISWQDFFRFWKVFKETRLYIPLHAVEFIFALGIAAVFGFAPAITGGLAFGLTHHLIIDQVGNGIRPSGYSLLLRWVWRFKSRKIFISWDTVPMIRS